MKLIKPSFSIWEQEPGLEGIYKQIEKSAKVCYKSEGNITEDSAKPFIDNVLLKRHHYSPLEHGTVYLMKESEFINTHIHPEEGGEQEYNPLFKYYNNPYSYVVEKDNIAYITTNLRVLVENNWLDDLKYICELTAHHKKRITVHFTCNRGVWNEFIRHRALARTDDTDPIDEDAERLFSFSQESQRYCNYSADKFGNEVTFIIPCWADSLALQEVKGTVVTFDDFGKLIGEYYYHLNGKEAPYFKTWEITPERNFIASLQIAEQIYLELLNQGWKPQQAREVLPNACKTELVMTGFVEDWINFFELRTASNAHPQARELAIPLREEFVKRGYINE